jgi:hypothetical protein
MEEYSEEEKEADEDAAAVFKSCSQFSGQINAHVLRQSREREGKGNRFSPQGIAKPSTLSTNGRSAAVESEIRALEGVAVHMEDSEDEEEVTWRVRTGEDVLKFEPLQGDYFIYYFDDDKTEEEAVADKDVEYSYWKYFKSVFSHAE